MNPRDVKGAAPAFDPRGTTPVAGARRHSVLAVVSLIPALLAALPRAIVALTIDAMSIGATLVLLVQIASD